MRFGVREICNVVLKAKAAQKVGKKIFYKNEPVMYFDTLKTSSLEGQSSTVYAQGGRGNPRLVAWEGERTVTFTMEDALISPEGLSILTGAGLIDAREKTVYQHVTEVIDVSDLDFGKSETDDYAGFKTGKLIIPLSQKPYLPTNQNDNFAYVMFMKDGEIITEPYIPVHGEKSQDNGNGWEEDTSVTPSKFKITVTDHENYVIPNATADLENGGTAHSYNAGTGINADKGGVGIGEQVGNYDVREFPFVINNGEMILGFDSVLVDYYVAKNAGATQIEITADKFGGNYYLEAETLFRTQEGLDMPAEFVIPNCKVQSNFNFAMSNTGDPSTFTFTMDSFPDYTRFDHTHKVFAAVQIIEDVDKDDLHRHSTSHEPAHDKLDWSLR